MRQGEKIDLWLYAFGGFYLCFFFFVASSVSRAASGEQGVGVSLCLRVCGCLCVARNIARGIGKSENGNTNGRVMSNERRMRG